MVSSPETVVGVDGSDHALAAARWAARDAALHNSALRIVSSTASTAHVPVPYAYRQALHRNGERAVEHARRIAYEAITGRAHIEVRTELSSRPPISLLLQKSADARMVVVGGRGREATTRTTLGSVSTALASHCQSPLAIVRGRWRTTTPTEGVVVGTDCSPASLRAVEAAFDAAAAREASLLVVHCWADDDLTLVHAFRRPSGPDWATLRAETRAHLDRTLTGLIDKFPQVRVETTVVRDRPVRALLDRAQAAQLLVVGSRGRGGFAGMLLGSTSRTVLLNTPTSVVIVPDDRQPSPHPAGAQA